jgi:hypothetical protein
VVHICCVFVAGRRLAGELHRLRAAGEPILPEDFNPTQALPDDENAAWFYGQAAATLSAPPGPSGPAEAILDDWRATEHYPEEARRVIEEHGRTLQLLRRGRFRDRADWGVRFSSPALFVILPHLSSVGAALAGTLRRLRRDRSAQRRRRRGGRRNAARRRRDGEAPEDAAHVAHLSPGRGPH